MSKLLNVINRLEKIANEDEEEQIVSDFPFQHVEKRSNFPLMRILIFSGSIILLGVVVLGIIAWWQDWFLLRQNAVVEDTVVLNEVERKIQVDLPIDPDFPVSPAEPVDEGEPFLSDQSKEITSIVPTASSPESLPSTVSSFEIDPPPVKEEEQALEKIVETVSVTKQEKVTRQPASFLPPEKKRTELTAPLVQKPVAEEPQKLVIPVVLPFKPVEKNNREPKVLFTEEKIFDGNAEKERQRVRLRRWLLQAEKSRKSGNIEGAIILYRKVWEDSQNPAVANNLAAALLQQNQNRHAYDILQKALQITPNDKELLNNFKLAKENLFK